MVQMQKRDWFGFFPLSLISHYTYYMSFRVDKRKSKESKLTGGHP